MFWVWAIPLLLLTVLMVWVLLYAMRGRVHLGEREPGRPIAD